MEAITWKCACGTEGAGFVPDECPTCGNYGNDRWPTEAGYRAMIDAHQALRRRAEEVCNLLGFGCDTLDFSYSDTFETKWERRACSRGCCGYETLTEDIPLRYLWMSDKDIRAEVESAKAEKAKAEAEAKAKADREAELRRAEENVALARAMAKSLPDAEARLAALRAGGAA